MRSDSCRSIVACMAFFCRRDAKNMKAPMMMIRGINTSRSMTGQIFRWLLGFSTPRPSGRVTYLKQCAINHDADLPGGGPTARMGFDSTASRAARLGSHHPYIRTRLQPPRGEQT